MAFTPKFTITNRMTQAITRIERARGFLEAAYLSAGWVREVGYQALILEAHHTTHIEVARLMLDQAKALGLFIQRGKLTIQDFDALCPTVNRRSLQRDLKGMLDKNLITAEGATHHQEYRLL